MLLTGETTMDTSKRNCHLYHQNVEDPYFRIGQLEGAIETALPYFERAVGFWEADDKHLNGGEYNKQSITEMRQVIANLKTLIGEKDQRTTTSTWP